MHGTYTAKKYANDGWYSLIVSYPVFRMVPERQLYFKCSQITRIPLHKYDLLGTSHKSRRLSSKFPWKSLKKDFPNLINVKNSLSSHFLNASLLFNTHLMNSYLSVNTALNAKLASFPLILNRLTGYSVVQSMKDRVKEFDEQLKLSKQVLETTKQAYERVSHLTHN